MGDYRLWFWSGIAGVGIAGNFIFYFESIAAGGVAVAATLMYCAPVFVYLISFSLRLERPTSFKWTSILLVMLGIVLLTGVYKMGAGELTLVAIGYGLLAGLSYAGFIFGFKYATPYGSPPAILVIAFSVLVLLQIFSGKLQQIAAAPASPSWSLFILLGVLGAGVSFIFYIIGLKRTLPSVASIMAMVEPVTAALFGLFILQESLDLLQLIGMGIILLSVSLLGSHS